MAKKDVDVRIRAHDRATKAFRQSGKAAIGWGKTMRRVGGLVAGFVGFRAIARLTSDSIRLFGEQRDAEVKLREALRLLGDETAEQLPRMKRFASSIQDVTTLGDEAVLQIMALGAGLGKLSGEALEQATKAAIGLSEKLGIDTVAAMRLVARAAIGDTAMLKRYGVTLDATLSPQEKFNELLRQGGAAFSLATAKAKEGLGPVRQLSNSYGDLKEMIGAAVVESDTFRGGIDLLKKSVKSLQELLAKKPAPEEAGGGPGIDIAAQLRGLDIDDVAEEIAQRFGAPIRAQALRKARARQARAARFRAEPGIEGAPSPLQTIAGMEVVGGILRRRISPAREVGRRRLAAGREAFAGITEAGGRPLRPELEKLTREELVEMKKVNVALEKVARNTEVKIEGRSFK